MSESTDQSSATGTTATTTSSSSKCPVQHSTTNQTVVDYSGKTSSSSSSSSSSSYSLWNFWRSSTKDGNTTGREINNDSIKNFKNGDVVPSTSSSSGCPVIHNNHQSMTDSSRRNSSSATNGTFLPFVPRLATASPFSSQSSSSQEHAFSHSQIPQPQQQLPLSTHRAISSIPKPCPVQNESTFTSSSASSENKQLPSNASTSRFSTSSSNTPSIPAHQPESSEKWVYPSEQQFYNAMKRKGWELPPGIEKSIPHVVRIHNAVNERGWKEILEWERMRNPKNDNPRLVRFIGKPKDLSPRARFYSTLWLRNEPFDRHDWFVDRGDGTGERRYVIDFYNGKEDSVSSRSISASNSASASASASTSTTNNSLGLPSMYLDVRPALDDLEAVQDRVKMFFRNAFPGIAAEFTSTASTKREQDSIGKMENPLASSSQGK